MLLYVHDATAITPPHDDDVIGPPLDATVDAMRSR
jgi:hypothetical protein